MFSFTKEDLNIIKGSYSQICITLLFHRKKDFSWAHIKMIYHINYIKYIYIFQPSLQLVMTL